MLKQALAIQLQQSSFLTLFPDSRVQHVLQLMTHRPDERVTAQIGRVTLPTAGNQGADHSRFDSSSWQPLRGHARSHQRAEWRDVGPPSGKGGRR